jgi:hypothetical protein
MDKDLVCVTLISIIGLAVSIGVGVEEGANQDQLDSLALEAPPAPVSFQFSSVFLLGQVVGLHRQ